jgi:hypothetical protein
LDGVCYPMFELVIFIYESLVKILKIIRGSRGDCFFLPHENCELNGVSTLKWSLLIVILYILLIRFPILAFHRDSNAIRCN